MSQPMDFADEIRHVFVYGTLKQGFLLSHVWPRQPLAVELGSITGALLDLGPYPAAVEGSGRILGELWQFRFEDMDPVLHALDEAEEYSPNRPQTQNLYLRKVVSVATLSGQNQAFAYFLANPQRFPSARPISETESFLGFICQVWK